MNDDHFLCQARIHDNLAGMGDLFSLCMQKLQYACRNDSAKVMKI
jgi:hypothetical protein